MASKYLLVLLIVVAALMAPSLGRYTKPSHHNPISPAPAEPEPEPEPPMPHHKPHHHKAQHDPISPGPAEPEPEPPMPHHKPHHHKAHHEHKHHKKEKHEPLVPAEPPKERFFPPTHEPSPPYFGVPVYPPMESGEGPAPSPYAY